MWFCRHLRAAERGEIHAGQPSCWTKSFHRHAETSDDTQSYIGNRYAPGAQVVLIDTPGLNEGGTALRRHMLQEIAQAMEGVDLLAVMVDASEPIGLGDRAVLKRAAQFKGKAILLLNKIDRVPKEKLLPLISSCSSLRDWTDIIPISARNGDGIELALRKFTKYLPEGPALYAADQFTDQPARFLAGEMVREKAMALTHEEVPHAIAAIVDSFEESPKLTHIRVTLYVEQEGQKGILIGKGGEMLKQIGMAARMEIEGLLGVKVFWNCMLPCNPAGGIIPPWCARLTGAPNSINWLILACRRIPVLKKIKRTNRPRNYYCGIPALTWTSAGQFCFSQ